MGGVGSGRRKECPECGELMVKLTRGGRRDAVFWCQECGYEEPVHPRKSTKRKSLKTRVVAFRVDEATFARLERRAAKTGLTVSEYLNRLVSRGRG